MQKRNSQFIYSPTDLTRYMESPFASWMDRYAIEFPENTPQRDPEDELTKSLSQKGYEHEDTLKDYFIRQGLNLVSIDAPSNDLKTQETLEAMQQGVDVIFQGRLEQTPFAGFSDFLVKVEHTRGEPDSLLGNWHYEVWDTKLSSKVKPTFVIQLCCYAEMLEAIQGVVPENIVVALGNGEQKRLRTLDYLAYYRTIKQAFLNTQLEFDHTQQPDPALSNQWANWSEYANQLLIERDHLSQVATITRSQIKKLEKAGITTMKALADTDAQYVPGLQKEVLAQLKAQASIQKLSEGKPVPEFIIKTNPNNPKQGLALLPPHSINDVFFDIEGYPLDDGGLEYLWGNTYFDEQGARQFKDFWAHNPEEEKVCFQSFIQWVYERWQADPSMHIYHYANYEIAACKKLMSRYGVCETEVDELLRNEVFVDLYKIVKGGMLLGEPRYSIKNVEHLYRGKRETEVGNGGESVVVYEQWRELNQRGEEGYTWETSKILNDIRKYNIDDCESTQELVEWLRTQQRIHNIEYLGRTEPVDTELSEEVTQRNELCEKLLKRADEESENQHPLADLTKNLAHVLEFHRRESKPVYWRLFERFGLTDVELMDDIDCLAACHRTDREPFKATPKARTLCYEYQFNTEQEFKGAANQFFILGEENEDGRNLSIRFMPEHSDLEHGLIVLNAGYEPPSRVTLIPNEVVGAKPIPEAIEKTVKEYEEGQLLPGHCAIMDFLTRAKPRIKGHTVGPIAPSHDPSTRLSQIISAVQNLDNSYLPIQGPPGAGKSFTGKHVIAELLKQGAKVGIASNSHKAINNLLLSTAKYCHQEGIAAHFVCTSDTDPALHDYEVTVSKNNQLLCHVQDSCVIGTTAWGFAREDLEQQFDYLFVDEAGQVSIANLIAMARSASNLVLLGDQMQLGQPSQASHPEESGLSVLDYLLHESPTISDEMGIFLGTTYRMHSKVNRFISDHIYEGKLESHPSNDQRTIDVPENYQGPLNTSAGLIFIPVEHEGNTQASDEEVEAIKTITHELLGRTFHTGNDATPTRSIEWQDILFVAPYNHQVSKLKQALGEKARVGSVDKFQGQEAPIVILSMCASDADESPRGMEFLFDKHRLNVAISRAQSLAVVVASPSLSKANVSRVEQLQLVNLFSAIAQRRDNLGIKRA